MSVLFNSRLEISDKFGLLIHKENLTMQNIIIFGASGKTGRELIIQGIAAGYNITAFVRNPKKIEKFKGQVKIVQGDVLDSNAVTAAVSGQDAVLCALGAPAKDNTMLRTRGTAHIVQAMHAHGVQRLICQTSLGFGDSQDTLNWQMKYIVVPLLLKKAFADHANQEAQIEGSNLDWTIVRPGNMTNGSRTGNYQTGFNGSQKIKLKVSRADVAEFMLEQIRSQKYLKEKVCISY